MLGIAINELEIDLFDMKRKMSKFITTHEIQIDTQRSQRIRLNEIKRKLPR